MNILLCSLHDLLCFITEDARAHRLGYDKLPENLKVLMNDLCNQLGEYLDELALLEIERDSE